MIHRLLSPLRFVVPMVAALVIGMVSQPSASGAAPAPMATGLQPSITSGAFGAETVGAKAFGARQIPRVRLSVRIAAPRFGGRVPIAVRVTGSAGTANGTVSASVDGRTLAAVRLRAGSGTLSLPVTWVGRATVVAHYRGDVHYRATKKGVSVRTYKALSRVTATRTTATYGHSPSVRVRVTGNGPAARGTVLVRRGSTLVGRATVRSGRATVAVSRHLPPATYRLSVRYTGDSRHAVGRGTAVVIVEAARPTLTATASSTTIGGRAHVAVRLGGAGGHPGGTVRLTGNGHTYSTARLSGGRATLIAPRMSVGRHSLAVRYAGSRKYRPAVSWVTVQVTRARSFGNGMTRVGVDAPSGLYRARVPAGNTCYWARLRDASGSLSGIIANNLTRGYALIRVRPSDRYVESSRCGTWRLVSDTGALPFRSGTIPGNGMFLVGKDIARGTYRQTKAGCYAASLSAATGTFGSIIRNDYTSGASYWTIGRTVKVFETSNCGTWHRVR